jgi:hypothetical protein
MKTNRLNENKGQKSAFGAHRRRGRYLSILGAGCSGRLANRDLEHRQSWVAAAVSPGDVEVILRPVAGADGNRCGRRLLPPGFIGRQNTQGAVRPMDVVPMAVMIEAALLHRTAQV